MSEEAKPQLLESQVTPAGGHPSPGGAASSSSLPEYAETGALTEEQSQIMDWLGECSNEATRTGKFDLWKSNIKANRPFFSNGNPTISGLSAFLVGAGPSLEKNAEDLKLVSERGIVVCVEASLRFLLRVGVVPEYCVSIDGSDKMLTMVEGCDTSRTTLVCTPSACPRLIETWKGPRYFVTTPTVGVEKKWNSVHLTRVVTAMRDIKQGEELYLDQEYEVKFGGITGVVMCGGNVSTAAHDFAIRHLRTTQVIFVGMDLSWQYESHHYAGHEHIENAHARTKVFPMSHKDVNGNDVYTNFSLMAFKRWHEAMARQMPGTVVNASEGGILGIGEQGVKSPFVEFLSLKEAVAKYAPRRT